MVHRKLPPKRSREWVIKKLIEDRGFYGYSLEYQRALAAEDQKGLDLALRHRSGLGIVRRFHPNIKEIGVAYQQIIALERAKA